MTFAYAAFDLDGTLLDDHRKIDDDTLTGLLNLRQQGTALFVVSGRSPHLVKLLDLPFDLFEPTMVLRDGDILWHWPTDTIESIRAIPPTVVPRLAESFPDYVVDTGRALVASSERAAARHTVTYYCPRSSVSLAPPPASPVAKATIYGDPASAVAALRGVAGCGFRISPHRCSLVPAGSCKTAGLARLLATTYREPTLDRLIAFGDGGNDACLLGTAGVGIAMRIADAGAARMATRQLTDSLAKYLNTEFPEDLTPRRGLRCPHRP